MDTSSSSGTTAVVIGGSIAGSLAAAALADYATQVVVVDRDVLPAAPVLRKGAPHAHQVHALTVGGRLAMEELLPGLTKNAVADGVPLIDTAKDIRYATKCGWLPRFDSEMRSLMASRPYIETLLRRHASALDNVTFRDSTEVTGWLLEDDRVVGVETRGPGDQVGQIRAGLVIDTMGRGSATPDWLEVHGYPRPEQTTINARWGYATVYLKPPAGWQPEFRSMFI
ncbi:MAG TPA: FAD-dependent monooxygenase, partial [Pseudonocardiaceae bacterium]